MELCGVTYFAARLVGIPNLLEALLGPSCLETRSSGPKWEKHKRKKKLSCKINYQMANQARFVWPC